MTLRELYFANNSWNVGTKLTICDENLDPIKVGIVACLANVLYGEVKVCQFEDNLVVIETLKRRNNQ